MRAEAPEPSIRGSYIAPSKAWVVRTYGADLYERALAVLPEEQRQSFASEIVSLSWYPLSQWTAVLDAVRAEVKKKTGEDGQTFDRRNLYESISGTMQTVYRVAFGMLQPTTVVARVTPYFKRVYSHGIYEVIENEKGRCVLRFSDAPVSMQPELERSFPLAATWMLEVAGQHVTRVRLTPRPLGRSFSCDLELVYEPKRR